MTQNDAETITDNIGFTLLISFVKTPEANPYSVRFALRKTPSTSLKNIKTFDIYTI